MKVVLFVDRCVMWFGSGSWIELDLVPSSSSVCNGGILNRIERAGVDKQKA